MFWVDSALGTDLGIPSIHETDKDILAENKKPCQPKNWVDRALHLNCVTDLVGVAIRERSFMPPVLTPAADSDVTGFDVGSVGDNLRSTVFGFINIAKCPRIFEGGTGSLATDGGSIVTVRIEWRIEIDKIDAIAIHPPHNV